MLATPGISTGYWKARNRPAAARSSGSIASRSCAVVADLAAGHLVALAAGQHVGERALARAVRPHDRVHLAGADLQVDAAQDLLVVDRDPKVLMLSMRSLKRTRWSRRRATARQPTLPSRLIASSFCASTANSIGSSCITSRQKPLTISADRVLVGQAALAAVEQLVLADLRGGRLVLDLGRAVLDLDVGHGVGAAAVADQHRVALGVVARVVGALQHPHQAAIGVVAAAGGDALGDDPRAGVLADVDHLGAGVGLLVVVGQRDRVELADRVVALQDAARVLPGDRRAGLDLGPGDLGVAAAAGAALGDEVVDAAPALARRPGTSSAPSST